MSKAILKDPTVIDADRLILGRLASITAKRLLDSEVIVIINAEKTVISGRKRRTFLDYLRERERGCKEKGPYFPRMPDQILKRAIRGMLPYKRERGRDALSRLRVCIGVPREYSNISPITIEAASANRLSTYKFTRLGEISHKLGATFEED
ncbi:MAG: 50S ribosomal protein L13 [Candidatus Syntrophoarchaeum sp. GoM_oil]|nr:MAG: 50S ribosomal protein L13 [Candidatus Syntrophoarchaeum sp. GoM_oil]